MEALALVALEALVVVEVSANQPAISQPVTQISQIPMSFIGRSLATQTPLALFRCSSSDRNMKKVVDTHYLLPLLMLLLLTLPLTLPLPFCCHCHCQYIAIDIDIGFALP